jgi:hypothetical protein
MWERPRRKPRGWLNGGPLVVRRSVDVVGSDAAVEYLVEFDDEVAVREVALDERGEPVDARDDYGNFAGECAIGDFPTAEVVSADLFESSELSFGSWLRPQSSST